jgi:hypothetical protein
LEVKQALAACEEQFNNYSKEKVLFPATSLAVQ